VEVSLQERSTLCCGGAAPVPVRLSAVAFEALLVNEPVAEALPDVCGVNVSANGTLCPAAITGIEFEARWRWRNWRKKSGDESALRTQLRVLESSARSKGFGLMARKAAATR
jgi:hypothetical protein